MSKPQTMVAIVIKSVLFAIFEPGHTLMGYNQTPSLIQVENHLVPASEPESMSAFSGVFRPNLPFVITA